MNFLYLVPVMDSAAFGKTTIANVEGKYVTYCFIVVRVQFVVLVFVWTLFHVLSLFWAETFVSLLDNILLKIRYKEV